MSMKVAFIKDYPEYEAGWEGFVPRSLGSRLCYQEIAVPYSIKDHHAGYKAMIKKKEEAKREAEREAKEKAELEAKEAEQKAKEKAELDAEKKIKALKKKDAVDRKTTTSKKVEMREKAIT